LTNLSTLINSLFFLLKFPEKAKISEWSDTNRQLSGEASAEIGKWKTSRAEYQREMMDVILDDDYEMVVFKTSSQIGKTEIELNIIGYFIDVDPCPILAVFPTETLARAFSEDRLSTMLRDTPCLIDKVKSARIKDSKNTKLHKMYPGGHITMVGANSPGNLAMRPIRLFIGDEVSRYPVSSGGKESGEGDVVTIAGARTKNFYNRKIILVSTPTIKGACRISKTFEDSDKRFFYVPCHACGKEQTLKWANVKWEKDKDKKHLHKTAHYVCEHCDSPWTEKERHVAVKNGRWVKTQDSEVAGFFINELYSPWSQLRKIVKEFLESKDDTEMLKAWTNTTLGEEWEEEGEQLDSTLIYDMREIYGPEIPDKTPLILGSVDTQDDRLEVLIKSWGENEESYGIEHIVLQGDPANIEIWERLDVVLQKRYKNESGVTLPITACTIDRGGHHADMVDKFVRTRKSRNIFAIQGRAFGEKPIVGKPSRKNKNHIPLFTINTDAAKNLIMSRLRTRDSIGAIHYNETFTHDFCKQLTTERRVLHYRFGQAYYRWEKPKHLRNEAFDLEVYNLGCLRILFNDIIMYNNYIRKFFKKEEKPVEPVEEFKTIQRMKPKKAKGGYVNNWKR
jgi:phage terminase large subunit GpA-like protein